MANATSVFKPHSQSLASHLALSIDPVGATYSDVWTREAQANSPALTAASDHALHTKENRDAVDDMYKYVWNALRGDQAIGALDLGVNKIKSGGVEFTRVAANPGGTAIDTLYQDDGTNFDAGTLWWGSDLVVDGPVSLGDPGVEQGSIMIAGGTFDANTKINDIGGAANASLIIHRHSETDGPEIVHTRTHDDTSGHTIVSDDDSLGGSYFAGHDGTDYNFAASILCFVDGTPGANDMPGRLEFSTTPDGANSTTLALMIDNAQDVHLPNGALLLAGAVIGDASSSAPDQVIGAGASGVNHGVTIFSNSNAQGNIVFTDGGGTFIGGLNYVHTGDVLGLRSAGAVRMQVHNTYFRPAGTGTYELGTVDRVWERLWAVDAYLGGAAAGDAIAEADDLVVGGGADAGITIHQGANNDGRLAFNNGTNDEDGAIKYGGTSGSESFTFRVQNSNELFLNDIALQPVSGGGLILGSAGNQWAQGHIDLMLWGVTLIGDGATVAATTGLVQISAPTSKSTFTLPTAVAGIRFEIDIADETATVDLDPDGGDSINGGVAGAVKNLVTAGKYFLYAQDAADWRLHGPIGLT